MARKLLDRENLPDKSPAQGRDDLIEQSHNQQNPRDARPEEFVILESDKAADEGYISDGQHGRNQAECRKIREASAADRGKSRLSK